MFWSVLRLHHLPSAPEQGVLVARVLAFGQYETGELAHQAMALDKVPAVERGLIVFVRGGELQLRAEHVGREGLPLGALMPPVIDWAASGCRPLFPELDPAGAEPPSWVAAALDHLADMFLPPPSAVAAFACSKTTALFRPARAPEQRSVLSCEFGESTPQKSNHGDDPTSGS
jgi:hypothetical protein